MGRNTYHPGRAMRAMAGMRLPAQARYFGDRSPESAGDYASGTNHVLPTYGWLLYLFQPWLADFQKRMTVQGQAGFPPGINH